ncbi:MAG TPA: phospholipid carrier-dependent glycosyltransferase, partial [Anaerolineae bacterium]|nr:phospholipid carrier-dependent glycosyltransferase [Anaerolineae bacterium]
MSRRATLWAMVAVLLLAAALRLAEFGRLPPGLYHDEAYHGLDAATVLAGDRPLYFPANNGREPLFIYLVAGAVGVLGRSPFALRLPALFAGLLTVAATGALGNALFSRRVGVLAAAVLAVTLWHVHLSRIGFRAVLLPLFTALTLWQGARAGLPHRRRAITGALLAGLFYGLTFYTYTAARFTPVALAVYAALLARRRRSLTVRAAPLLAAVAAALLTLLPLAVYTVLHPQEVLGRPGQVFVWNAAISHGDPWGLLAHNLLATLGMFFWRGDRIWRHNVPWRPVFDPLLGLMFLLGLLVALRRARRSPAALLLIVWTAVMSLPTVLAEDAPHFLRAVGLLPLIALLPALGLDWVMGWAGGGGADTRSVLTRVGIVAFVLLVGLLSTAWAYFGDYARNPMTGY